MTRAMMLANVRGLRAGSALGRALLADLDDEDIAALADALVPHLPAPRSEESGWLDSQAAASYLGITRNALHKHTAARAISFEQDCPGGKLWFRRSDLDAWREGRGS